jgi:hypothetical protein
MEVEELRSRAAAIPCTEWLALACQHAGDAVLTDLRTSLDLLDNRLHLSLPTPRRPHLHLDADQETLRVHVAFKDFRYDDYDGTKAAIGSTVLDQLQTLGAALEQACPQCVRIVPMDKSINVEMPLMTLGIEGAAKECGRVLREYVRAFAQ